MSIRPICGNNSHRNTQPMTWTQRSPNFSYPTSVGVVLNLGGIWLYMGDRIYASTDPIGSGWSIVYTPSSIQQLRAMAYDGIGTWVAVSDNAGSNTLVVSTNPLSSWTERSIPGSSYGFSGIAYGNGLWVAKGYYLDKFIYTATDPMGTWTQYVSSYSFDDDQPITFINGYFLITGRGLQLWSTDGITWNRNFNNPCTGPLSKVAYGQGKYMFSNYKAPGECYYTNDPTGSTFTLVPNGTHVSEIWGFAYGNGAWVLGTLNNDLSTSGIYSQPFILRAKPLCSPGHMVTTISYGNGLWIAVESTGAWATAVPGV